MPKFRKKPVVIEAVQLTWEHWCDICEFIPKPWFIQGCYVDENGRETTDHNGRIGLKMRTLESNQFLAVENDWIIKGVKNEFYPIKEEIFRETYEPVDAPRSESDGS